ncbi:MAG: hypothetical protein Q9227_005042 [Pyrenula ochraceoflavens]
MSDTRLFSPLRIGRMQLQHRLVMAPLTRFRADESHVPLAFVKEYYAQRASVPGTLLITEATFITPQAGGAAHVPGIWSPEQISAWKNVTQAIHEKESFIYLQLWALGRAADPQNLKAEGNFDYVSSSATPLSGKGSVPPRPLTVAEIKQWVEAYAQAARNAIEAGFDGVEIHGANGYLIDQFTQDVANHRTDEYGGNIENRSRFALEVATAVVDAVGADRTGIRLSPWSVFQEMKMKDPVPQFSHLIKGLKALNLAYLHVVESRIAGNADVEATEKVDFAIDIWGQTSPVLVAGGFKPDSAKRAVDDEYTENDIAIVFGRLFIPNPDLPFRIKNGLELKPYERSLFYNKTEEHGYIDYPFSAEFEHQSRL